MSMSRNTWLARLRAIRKVAVEYGLDGDALATIGEISRSPAPERSIDYRYDRQKQRSGITEAFDANATLDRAVPSHMPEPSVIHRHVG
jgi:hypothetical protein